MSDFRPDIWRLQANFDTKGLIAALQHEDAGVRKRAAAALRALGATDSLPMLRAALDKEQDTETRANILAALEALEQEKDRDEVEVKPSPVKPNEFDVLLEQLNSSQPEKVIAAAMKLGDMRDKRAVEPLVVLFNNGKIPVKVRLAIAEALLRLESAPVEVALLGALRSTKWKIRRNGAAILGNLRADWAVEPLAKALQDENEEVRKMARAALKHIDTPESRAALEVKEPDNSHKTDTLRRPPRPVVPPTPPPTEPARPVDQPKGDGDRPPQKLVWPKREIPPEEDPSKVPTRPLDHRRLEEAEDRLNGNKPGD